MAGKISNFENKEYEILFKIPVNEDTKRPCDGLCGSPTYYENPQILIDPKLKPRRKLNVLIEEVFHAYFFNLPEYKARKFAANLGKTIYKYFMKQDQSLSFITKTIFELSKLDNIQV